METVNGGVSVSGQAKVATSTATDGAPTSRVRSANQHPRDGVVARDALAHPVGPQEAVVGLPREGVHPRALFRQPGPNRREVR